MRRRRFLGLLAAGGLARCASAPAPVETPAGEDQGPPEAVCFDGFPVFDPRPVFGRARPMLGEQAPAFVAAWRGALFRYQWLRALGQRYRDFLAVGDDALRYAERATGVTLTSSQREQLAAGFRELRPWPDAREQLTRLRDAGLRLAVLSNMTPAMLRGGVRRGGLDGLFEHVISTDAIGSYKPAPAAYALGARAFGLPRGRVAFAAFAGWDAAGAAWFGYRTVWVNRLDAPTDALGAEEVPIVPDLAGLRAALASAGEGQARR